MTKPITINEAILHVMRIANTPLSPAEAYERIVGLNLYDFHAQNPLSVVAGQIRKHCKDLYFPSAAPNKLFGLSSDGKFYPLPSPLRQATDSPVSGTQLLNTRETLGSILNNIKTLQEKHKNLLKERIIKDLQTLNPALFEDFSGRLLVAYGFEEINVTQVSRDGGIDGYGKLKVGLARINVSFQCKRWTTTNIGRPEIDKFRGASQGKYELGIFFTTAHFSAGAKDVSIIKGAVPIILIDGPSIADLMIDKHFGVEHETLSVYKYSLDSVFGEQ